MGIPYPRKEEEEAQMAAPTMDAPPPSFTPEQAAPAAQDAAQGSINQLAQMKSAVPEQMGMAPPQLPMINEGMALAPPGTNALGHTPQEEDALKKSLFRG